MFDTEQFKILVGQLRAGDEGAAGELVRRFEPLILREVRLRLEDRRLFRARDAQDICQSVLASFFVRTGMGEFDLSDPNQSVRLLLTITRRKVASFARHEHRQKRDRRRLAEGPHEQLAAVASREPTPSSIVAGDELFARATTLLAGEERHIAALRQADCSWQEVARRLGGTAQARRVQFMRAMRRVTRQLGFEGPSRG